MKKKKKKTKKILIILGSILLLFLLIIAILASLFFTKKPLVKGIVEKQIEKRTGIPVTIGELDYKLFPMRIEAGDIAFVTKLDETEVDVFVEKLVLRGNVHRIRKKQKPYFTTIEAEGLRLRSDIKESEKKIAIEDILRDLSSGMTYVRKLSLKNSSLEFHFPEQNLTLQGTDISLAPSKLRDTFTYSLQCRNIEGIGGSGTARFQSSVRGSGRLFLGEIPAVEGRFILASNRFSVASQEEYFDEIRLDLAGQFYAEKKEFILPSLVIEIPSLVHLSGPLNVFFQDEMTILFRPRLRIDDLNRIRSLAKDKLPLRWEGLVLDGSALFEGDVRISPADPVNKAAVSGLVVLNPSRLNYRAPGFRIESRLSGSFKIDEFPTNQNITGRLAVDRSSFLGNGLEASGIRVDIPFAYDHKSSKIRIRNAKATADVLHFDTPTKKFETSSPVFSGQGMIDLKKREFQVLEGTIELPPFPEFDIAARAGLDPRSSISFSAKSSRIGFRTVLDFFSFAIPRTVSDWEPDGWADIRIEAGNSIREKDEVWTVSAALEATDVSFHDPPFTLAGESLHPKIALEGTFDRGFEDVSFAAKLELSQGESLWKDFYIDWSKMPLTGTARGRYHAKEKTFTDLSIGAAIPDFGTITAEGRLDLQDIPAADLEVFASELRLSPIYTFIGQKRTAGQTQIEMEGEAKGWIDAKIAGDAFSLLGHLEVNNASWKDAGSDLAVQGIEAFIPIQYARNTKSAAEESGPPKIGYLNCQTLRSSSLDLSGLRLDISSTKSGYTIQPFELDIFGQKALVGKISVEMGSDLSNLKARTSFSWKEGDLSKLPFSSQDFPLEGKLSVDLPLVEIVPDHILTEGQTEANAFGGKIVIDNIQVHQPLSKNRTISCDMNLSGLDLEKITDAIPFGRVTGIMNGEIKGLALSYGQPERFDIRIASEKRKGIPQRFSMKATNDLAILGTGEKTPFSTQSGWTRFVKEFRYEKIGIACSLKNDIFSLRGTIKGKGVEYLVKGSGLFAINVVNKQTRNQIQFKDMLNRLKRIGQSQQSP